MTDVLIYSKINALPPNLKREVVDFVDFLQAKRTKLISQKKRTFGYAKGAIILKPGFDEPLEEFKEYM